MTEVSLKSGLYPTLIAWLQGFFIAHSTIYRHHCTLHAFGHFGALDMHNLDDKHPTRPEFLPSRYQFQATTGTNESSGRPDHNESINDLFLWVSQGGRKKIFQFLFLNSLQFLDERHKKTMTYDRTNNYVRCLHIGALSSLRFYNLIKKLVRLSFNSQEQMEINFMISWCVRPS